MADLKEHLDREAHRIDAPPRSLEHIHAIAARRLRRRRIVAGGVALAVAGGALLVVGRLAPDQDRLRPGGGGSGSTNLWPHPGPGDAAHAQERADGGDRGVVWQLNPLEVGLRFVTDELGWDAVVLLDRNGPELELLGCDLLPAIGCETRDIVRLTLGQPVRSEPTGVWGVQEVDRRFAPAPAPSPGTPGPSPSPGPTTVAAAAERTAVAFARARVSGEPAALFLERPAADVYHGGELSLHADYRGFDVGGSELLEDGRVRVWIGMVTEVTADRCWTTAYETVVIHRGKVVEAEHADGVARECASSFET